MLKKVKNIYTCRTELNFPFFVFQMVGGGGGGSCGGGGGGVASVVMMAMLEVVLVVALAMVPETQAQRAPCYHCEIYRETHPHSRPYTAVSR